MKPVLALMIALSVLLTGCLSKVTVQTDTRSLPTPRPIRLIASLPSETEAARMIVPERQIETRS